MRTAGEMCTLYEMRPRMSYRRGLLIGMLPLVGMHDVSHRLACISQTCISQACFTGAPLTGVLYRRATYRRVFYRRASYRRALTGVPLTGIHLTGVHLIVVHRTGVHLLQACISRRHVFLILLKRVLHEIVFE
jgi:hypothetical protein